MIRKKNIFIASTIIAFGMIASTTAAVLLSKNGNPLSRLEADEYTVVFNNANGGSSFSSSYVNSDQTNSFAKTTSGYTLAMDYKNGKKSNNNYIDLQGTSGGAGYVYNTTDITGIKSITVKFSGSLSLYVSDSTSFPETGESINNNQEYTYEGGDTHFKLLNSGSDSAIIEQITVKYSCTPLARYYEKVTENGSVENGQYLIVYENGSKAFDGGLDTLDAVSNNISVSISNNKIEKTATTAAAEFTISGTSIQSKSGKYIGNTSDANALKTNAEDIYTNNISISEGNAVITSSGSYLRFNAGSSDNRFRYYKSSSYTNQQPIALYKLGGSGGGGDDPTPTPTTETYEVTITYDNSGVTGTQEEPTTSEIENSWTLSDNKTSVSGIWGPGLCNGLEKYQNLTFNAGSYFKSNSSIVVKSMHIVFGSNNPLNYATIYANGSKVTGTGSDRTYDFDINSSNWSIENETTSSYFRIVSITIYCEIEVGPIAVTGVSLNTNSLELYESSSQTLVATVSPANATNKNVTWSSTNESVATVDSSGKVSALSAGTTTITVTTEDGSKTASCLVTVKASVKVTSVTLNKSSTTLTRTHTETLTATVLPENASNKAVTWSSNNETVASVSSTGVVTANAVGTATITVTTQDGNKTATCDVTVNPIPVSSVTLDQESLDIKVGQAVELTATITPDNADSQTVTWSVNKNIVTLSSTTGKTITVTGATASEDSATITATCGGQSATCTVTVSESSTPVVGSEFELVSETSDLNSGDYVILGCYAKQAVAGAFNGSYLQSVDATIANDKVTLTDDMEVFEVEISGSNYNFKAIALAEYYLGYSGTNLTQEKSNFSVSISSGTLTMSGGSNPMRYNNDYPRFRLYSGSTKMSTVQFYKLSGKVTGVSLNASDIGLNNGDTYQLTATVLPAGALNKNVTWASSNESVATVNTEGLVTASSTAASGSTATITVTTVDGSKTATCKITVMSGSTIVPTSITLNKTSGSIAVGETVSLQANLKPENVTDKSVTWTSNKTSVATVSSSGVVTGVGEGSATITAKTVNNLTATFTVTVTAEHIDEWTIMIYMCGSDLESGNGYATSDITEILDTVKQGYADYNEDVNIIFETGGSTSWKKYGISKDNLERYHVQNGTSIVREDSLTYSAMGKQSTFESFLKWGLDSYPAKKTGVILWNHGGGMTGVCHDEKSSGDDATLLNSEIKSAFANKIGSNKLEFVGYDACLMQVQDIAETNSDYFNYMVAAQESEAGEGWAYTDWVDNLYNGDDTETILKEITRSFVASYKYSYNDQTLSALDLTKMSAYKTAIENIAADVGNAINSYNGSSGKTKFQLYAKHNIKGFGTSVYDNAEDLEYYEDVSTDPTDPYYYENYGIEYDESTGEYTSFGSDYFGSFDAYDFLTTVSSLKTLSSTKLKAVKDAIDDMVVSNDIGDYAGNCCGICIYFNTHNYANKSKYYSNSQTRFANWRSMVNTYAA